MRSALYRLPPLPNKRDYLKRLLTGPYAIELFVDEIGEPVFAMLMKSEQVSDQERRLYQQVLRLAAQAEDDSLAQASRAMMREAAPGPLVYQLKPDVVVDLTRYSIQRGNELIALGAREAELLYLLLHHPRTYFSAHALAEAIGSEGIEASAHSVEDMICQLRRKLGEPPFRPTLIRCKRYAGYAIFPEESRPLAGSVPQSQTREHVLLGTKKDEERRKSNKPGARAELPLNRPELSAAHLEQRGTRLFIPGMQLFLEKEVFP